MKSLVDFIVVIARAIPIRHRKEQVENFFTSSSGARRIPG
jgi:hypothetical protein